MNYINENIKFVDVGNGNFVSVSRVVSVVTPDSLPVRRMMQDAKNAGRAIDITCGKKTKSVIITDSDHYIFSAEDSTIIAERMISK
jgi:regulator of extracellular matrix RemA (YlzA/DUF370 family)